MYAIVAAAAEKARESLPDLKMMPSVTFDDGMVKDFETFARAVEKELNLTGLGCIAGVKSGGAGERGKKQSSGGGQPSSGGKRPAAPAGTSSKKPAAKRPKKGPSSSSSSKGRRETSPERQERLNQRDRVPKNADPLAQERGAAAAEAGRRKR